MGWTLAIAALLTMLFVLFSDTAKVNEPPQTLGRVDHYAASLLVYHHAVEIYARANPSSVGVVAMSSLSLPTWYTSPGWTANITSDGYARTFAPQPNTMFRESTQMLANLSRRSFGAYTVGQVSVGGYLNPAFGFIADPNAVAGLSAGTIFISTKYR